MQLTGFSCHEWYNTIEKYHEAFLIVFERTQTLKIFFCKCLTDVTHTINDLQGPIILLLGLKYTTTTTNSNNNNTQSNVVPQPGLFKPALCVNTTLRSYVTWNTKVRFLHIVLKRYLEKAQLRLLRSSEFLSLLSFGKMKKILSIASVMQFHS